MARNKHRDPTDTTVKHTHNLLPTQMSAMRDPPGIARREKRRRLLSQLLSSTEDRRTLPHVDEISEGLYLRISGAPARVSYAPTVTRRQIPGSSGRFSKSLQYHHYFQNSESVAVCQRRKIRRRVLFALKKTGRGGRANRRAKWTAKSFIRCR